MLSIIHRNHHLVLRFFCTGRAIRGAEVADAKKGEGEGEGEGNCGLEYLMYTEHMVRLDILVGWFRLAYIFRTCYETFQFSSGFFYETRCR